MSKVVILGETEFASTYTERNIPEEIGNIHFSQSQNSQIRVLPLVTINSMSLG